MSCLIAVIRRRSMRRRDLIFLTGGAMAWSFAALGQQSPRRRRIGVLMPATREGEADAMHYMELFLLGLREAGWTQDKDFTLEMRYANGDTAKIRNLVRDLVSINVDVIVTSGTEAIQASRDATSTTPIVMVTIGDPVGAGVIKSLSHPGGNVTGLSLLATGLSAKRVELVRSCIPKAS